MRAVDYGERDGQECGIPALDQNKEREAERGDRCCDRGQWDERRSWWDHDALDLCDERTDDGDLKPPYRSHFPPDSRRHKESAHAGGRPEERPGPKPGAATPGGFNEGQAISRDRTATNEGVSHEGLSRVGTYLPR